MVRTELSYNGLIGDVFKANKQMGIHACRTIKEMWGAVQMGCSWNIFARSSRIETHQRWRSRRSVSDSVLAENNKEIVKILMLWKRLENHQLNLLHLRFRGFFCMAVYSQYSPTNPRWMLAYLRSVASRYRTYLF